MIKKAIVLFLIVMLLLPAVARATQESVLEKLIIEEREKRLLDKPEETVTSKIRTGKLDPVHASESAAKSADTLLRAAQAWALPIMILLWMLGAALWIIGAFSGAQNNKGPAIIMSGTVGYLVLHIFPLLVAFFLNWVEGMEGFF